MNIEKRIMKNKLTSEKMNIEKRKTNLLLKVNIEKRITENKLTF